MVGGLRDDLASGAPIPRIGEPSEVTALMLFIVQEATYSTGHEFIIDGGATVGSSVEPPSQ